ncbi:MAG TPA: isochorismatase family protein [Selenomonadales bacterium]|nr:isochorismatase family protein [Selenomonadales bacterium]
MNPALLVVDVQNLFFTAPETAQSLRQAIPAINAAIALFRQKGLPVVCVQHIDEADGLTPGTEAFAVPPDLALRATDPCIHKRYGNAFNKTPLEELLKSQGVDTVIITGYCAEHCVLSTCRGARDCDFTAILLRGALASDTAAHIPFVERINDIISLRALAKALS